MMSGDLFVIMKKKIHLPDFGTRDFLKRVLIHKLTHAFIFEYSLMLNTYKAIDKSFEEEKVCDMFSSYAEEIISLSNLIMAHFAGVDGAKNR